MITIAMSSKKNGHLLENNAAYLSDEDADLLGFPWYPNKRGYITYNIYDTATKKWIRQHMHRIVLSRMLPEPLESWEEVDHIDGNTANNQRNNLRKANRHQQNANAKKRKDNTSNLKGVHLDKRSGKWVAQININGKRTHLGYFTDKYAAKAVYDEKALEIQADFANDGEESVVIKRRRNVQRTS